VDTTQILQQWVHVRLFLVQQTPLAQTFLMAAHVTEDTLEPSWHRNLHLIILDHAMSAKEGNLQQVECRHVSSVLLVDTRHAAAPRA
jgi:hypothetical protein